MRRDPEELGYIEAELLLVPSERGGHKTAIRTGYRPNRWLPGAHDRIYASASLEVVDSPEIAPGAHGMVRLYPFAPKRWQHVQIGSDLVMSEGPTNMGDAKVTRIVPAAAAVGQA